MGQWYFPLKYTLYKHSSLLIQSVSDEEKSFIKLTLDQRATTRALTRDDHEQVTNTQNFFQP
jgi:hypothetical protein